MITRILNILLLVPMALYINGQNIDTRNFTLYTSKEGLSHNYVNSVTQDSYGYIWIATYKGLNRFDGNIFQQFFADSSRNSLPQDFVQKLSWIDNDQLAVLTNDGLHIINTKTLARRNLLIPQDSLKPHRYINRTMDATGDGKGNIFIITGSGFFQFNNKDQLVFRFDYFSLPDPKKTATFGWSITKITDNILFLSTFTEPYLYYIDQKDIHAVDKKDDPFYREMARSQRLLTEITNNKKEIDVIVPDENSFSWFNITNKRSYSIRSPFSVELNFTGGVGSNALRLNDSVYAITSNQTGLYIINYDREKDAFKINPQRYFENYRCTSLFIDKNGRLCIGTNKGLLREKRYTGKIDQINLTEGVDDNNSIISLSVCGNKIFVGTSGNGIYVMSTDDLKKIKRLDFSREGNEYVNIIYSLLPIDKDTIYAGTAGFWINTKNFNHGKLPVKMIDSSYDGIDLLFKDSRNNIYLKKASSKLFYYRGADKMFRILDYNSDLNKIGVPTAIAEDPSGNIWFGANGLMRLNSLTKKFDIVTKSLPEIGINNLWLTSNIVFDKGGRMYFGGSQSGLIIYDPLKKISSKITRIDGLPDNAVVSVSLYKNKIWIATESGLACYNLDTKKISSFGISDGIPTDPISAYWLCYDSNQHKMYGAFRNILYRFDPDKLSKNDLPPDFFIESIVVTGKQTIYHPSDKIELSYKNNNIVLNLGTINFEDTYQQRFAYRFVKNGAEAWQETGLQNSIIFSNLSAGTHKLQVKVYTRNKSWPEQIKEITIIIFPPFWKTAWFYLVSGLSLISIAYNLHRRRIKQITQKANLDNLLAQTEMKALHSQMNPHFIFNCLNSIREMILNNENEQASLYLSKFARLIRITLNQSAKTFVSLEDTIDYLQRYLEMEQIRKSNFVYTIDVDENLLSNEILLPPMLIQPFIENAIWHGASPGKEMHVNIQFKRETHNLICIIEDDGIGIETSLKNKEPQLNYQSVGISNIKQRIQVLNEKYNLHSTLDIKDKSGLHLSGETGTIVTIHLPIKTSES